MHVILRDAAPCFGFYFELPAPDLIGEGAQLCPKLNLSDTFYLSAQYPFKDLTPSRSQRGLCRSKATR